MDMLVDFMLLKKEYKLIAMKHAVASTKFWL